MRKKEEKAIMLDGGKKFGDRSDNSLKIQCLLALQDQRHSVKFSAGLHFSVLYQNYRVLSIPAKKKKTIHKVTVKLPIFVHNLFRKPNTKLRKF